MHRAPSLLAVLLALFLHAPVAAVAAVAPAQNDPARQRLVLQTDAMKEVRIERDLVYWTRADEELRFDVYLPADAGERGALPTVLFLNGSGPELKDAGQYVDWGRLCAASGLAAVTFQARRGADSDFDDLLVNLRDRADELHLDLENYAVWACSGNSRNAHPWTMRRTREDSALRCAVFYYGVMSTETGSPSVPVFVARAGLDTATINDSIDAYVAAALKANTPLTLLNLTELRHAFDLFDDVDESRRVVRATIAFLRAGLGLDS